MRSISAKIGCSAETLRKWVRQTQTDEGKRPGLSTDERERVKDLKCEVKEPRRATPRKLLGIESSTLTPDRGDRLDY